MNQQLLTLKRHLEYIIENIIPEDKKPDPLQTIVYSRHTSPEAYLLYDLLFTDEPCVPLRSQGSIKRIHGFMEKELNFYVFEKEVDVYEEIENERNTYKNHVLVFREKYLANSSYHVVMYYSVGDTVLHGTHTVFQDHDFTEDNLMNRVYLRNEFSGLITSYVANILNQEVLV